MTVAGSVWIETVAWIGLDWNCWLLSGEYALPYFLNFARLQLTYTLQDLNHLHGNDESKTLTIAAYQFSGLLHHALFYQNSPACSTRSTFGRTSGVLQSVPRVRIQ